MTQGADPAVQAIDLPWVAELRPFDCWNTTAHSPWDKVEPLTMDFALPVPLGIELSQASLVLLMQLHAPSTDPAVSDPDRIQQTLEDVRRLATLCIQTQDMIALHVGADILDREREAVEYLASQGRMPEGWAVVPEADTARLIRLSTIVPAFASLFTAPRHQDLIVSESFGVGRCAGIREGTRTALLFQGLLADEQLQWLHGVLDRSAAMGCHHDDILAFRHRPEKRLDHYEPFDNPLMTPAMRRSNALALVTMLPSYSGWAGTED